MSTQKLLAALMGAAVLAGAGGTAHAAASGRFLVNSDGGTFGNTDKSLVFYDVDNFGNTTQEMFTIVMPFEDFGDLEDPNSITIDQNTGMIYVAAFDTGIVGDVRSPGGGLPDDGRGDIDIYRIDFNLAFDTWVAGGKVQTDFYPDQFILDDFNLNPGTQLDHKNPVLLNGVTTKVGEVARSAPTVGHPTVGGATFFGQRVEVINDDMILMLDDVRVSPNADPLLDNAADDHVIRLLRRVGTDPNNPPAEFTPIGPGGTGTVGPDGNQIGGSLNGTSEVWESIILGKVNLDAGGFSEPKDMVYYKDPATGVQGVWILEGDGGANDTVNPANNASDDLAFFQITNFDGEAGNTFRTIANTGQNFVRVTDDGSIVSVGGNGAGDTIAVDPNTGKLFITESDFFDNPQGEPSIISLEVLSFDSGGGILLGSATEHVLNLTGLTDDDPAVVDSRFVAIDYVNNVAYFRDRDNPTEGGSFLTDLIALDLTTGQTTVIAQDWANFDNFPERKPLMFFCLGDNCGGALLEGDLNGDGFVGIGDLNIVLGLWNQNVTPGDLLQGDPTGDGFVGIADLNVILGNWNAGTPLPPGGAVPEPASLALFTIAGLSALGRRRSSGGIRG